jgi:alpha-galactosidase
MWVKKNLAPVREVQAETPESPKEREVGIFVIANHDPVQKNSRGGKPMKLGTAEYSRGLYCHATSRLLVRLPHAGRTFDAVIGVDNNENTQAGGGSVHFFVLVGEKEVFRSDLVRGGGRAGTPVHIDLGAQWSSFCASTTAAMESPATRRIGPTPGSSWHTDDDLAGGPADPRGPGPPLPARSVFQPPFSFVYGGRSSDSLLGSWRLDESSRHLDRNRTQRTQAYTDPQTGLVVRCEIVEYHDFPTVEWTLYFKNTGSKDTPILENVQSLDTQFERAGHPASSCSIISSGAFALPTTTASGDRAQAGDRQAIFAPPEAAQPNSDLPYFNLENRRQRRDRRGGLPGQWAARFVAGRREICLRVAARARADAYDPALPARVLQPLISAAIIPAATGIDGQNTWRRLDVDSHKMPIPAGGRRDRRWPRAAPSTSTAR